MFVKKDHQSLYKTFLILENPFPLFYTAAAHQHSKNTPMI